MEVACACGDGTLEDDTGVVVGMVDLSTAVLYWLEEYSAVLCHDNECVMAGSLTYVHT